MDCQNSHSGRRIFYASVIPALAAGTGRRKRFLLGSRHAGQCRRTDLRNVRGQSEFFQFSGHLEIFSSLALQLGAEPRLWSRCSPAGGRCRYWTPAYLPYHTDLPRMLAAAIDFKERSRQKYLVQASWIRDENVCGCLQRIAEDEILHLQALKGLYRKYVPPDRGASAGRPSP